MRQRLEAEGRRKLGRVVRYSPLLWSCTRQTGEVGFEFEFGGL